MNKIKIIIGLGNPLSKYRNTRHNVGSWYVLELANLFNLKLKKKTKFLGYYSYFFYLNKKIFLFIPNVFMNINGLSVLKIANFYSIKLEEMFIIHDELDLLPGIIKLRNGYGSNGHKGLKNIIGKFKKKTVYKRLSIGIGRPNNKKDISDFVLSKPTNLDKKKIFSSIRCSINKLFVNNF
ncbi:aminoacyl-tRNA hydrolase [Buchnera aphidicola]|uniref:aminoacyl-tRNA hydrolase n=1 Tax=Buchnera aphidicola TaxID=9 RepID=UPI00209320BA|nr:aminoacyl-tRNA hydrolase [Buchnera aphidicola]USS94571.1 aminoacyl-tRNA hydrolase [Buchnera aphidicola (Periphyllus lyropictus)]